MLSRILPAASLLSIPILILTLFGWRVFGLALLATMLYVVHLFLQSERQRQWEQAPANKVVRSFSEWFHFHLRFIKKERHELDDEALERLLSESFRTGRLKPFFDAHQKMIGDIAKAAKDFERELKLQKGYGMTEAEIVFCIERVEETTANLRREFSDKAVIDHEHSEYFRQLAAKAQDRLGLDAWGQPIGPNGSTGFHRPIIEGIRLGFGSGPVDLVRLEDRPAKGALPRLLIGCKNEVIDATDSLSDDQSDHLEKIAKIIGTRRLS